MTQVVFDVSAFINSRHVGAVQYGIAILLRIDDVP
jgi:hypothetical protein